MKVGILGSGDVGQAIGRGFSARGHEVKIGSRTPDKPELKKWKREAGAKASLGKLAEAAAFGEVLVMATMGVGAEAAIETAGVKNFDGKTLIDVTNPLDFSKGMPPGLFVGTSDSLGERIQRKVPKAKVVKAFNTISAVQMVDPKLKGAAPKLLIAGNDAKAKKQVEGIAKDFGRAGVYDIGGIEGARWLEAHVPLWVAVAGDLKTYHHIFQPLTP
jgi:predicted dinucleotide-binding enzyme